MNMNMLSKTKYMYSYFILRAAAGAVVVSGIAAGVLPAFGASNDVTISNGGLTVTFNLSWGAVVTSMANTNVANGLNIVDATDVGVELQEDQALYQNIGGSLQMMLNPTQGGAYGNQPYYQHPNGSQFPEVGSPVVSWSASASQFQAVITPLDFLTGNPTDWVYVENVNINSQGVANFHYTCYDYQPGSYIINTNVPILYSLRTDAFMYPASNGSVQMVTGAPAWPQPNFTSNGWIASIDTQDNLGIFYTTPVGLSENYGTQATAARGITHVGVWDMSYPGNILSNEFSVAVGTPQNGPALISRQAPATFTVQASMISNGVFSANAAAYTAAPGYSSGVNPAAPTGWAVSGGNTGVNGPDTGVYGSTDYQPFAPASTAGVSDFSFLQGKGAFISQAAGTTAGQSYTLTFDAAARAGYPLAILDVVLTNGANGSQITTLIPTITSAAFTPFFLNFTATSGSTRIEFLNNSLSGIDATVDVSNVSLTAVPEPATLGLLAIGSLALVSRAGRRKRKARMHAGRGKSTD